MCHAAISRVCVRVGAYLVDHRDDAARERAHVRARQRLGLAPVVTCERLRGEILMDVPCHY